MHELTRMIREDMVPALGVTEPGAIAFCAAFDSVELALGGAGVDAVHGINGATPEETMRNMGLIASPGMTRTEETIVAIQQGKQI